jgi:hypothetical protein
MCCSVFLLDKPRAADEVNDQQARLGCFARRTLTSLPLVTVSFLLRLCFAADQVHQ